MGLKNCLGTLQLRFCAIDSNYIDIAIKIILKDSFLTIG